jgi:hypothetical protein
MNAPDTYIEANAPQETMLSESFGPTAQTVNAAAATRKPVDAADYYARGGLGNTINSARQNVMRMRARKQLDKQFQQLLSRQEAGADEIVTAAVKEYGQDIVPYMPKKIEHYDTNTGAFMPYQYAKTAHERINQYRQDLAAREEEAEKQRKEQATIAGRTQLQELGSGFSGTAEDFKKSAYQLPSYPQKEITSQDINEYASAFGKSMTIRDKIAIKNAQLAQEKHNLENYKVKAGQEKEAITFITESIKQWNNELKAAIQERHAIETSMDKATANPFAKVDQEEIAEKKRLIKEYRDQEKALSDNIKMGFVKLQEPGTTSLFHSPSNVPTSVIGGDYNPELSSNRTVGSSPSPIDPSDIYRTKAIELLNNSGRQNPSEDQIQFIMGKLKDRASQPTK